MCGNRIVPTLTPELVDGSSLRTCSFEYTHREKRVVGTVALAGEPGVSSKAKKSRMQESYPV